MRCWLIGALLACPVIAQTPDFESPSEAFARGEAAYQQGEYLDAEAIYRSMIEQGFDNGAIHYNRGNAWFKAGELGQAILGYERALQRMPSDQDAEANLSFANELIADAVEPAPLPVIVAWLVRWYRSLSLQFLSVVVAVGSLVTGLLVAIWLLEWAWVPASKQRVSQLALVGFALVACSGMLLSSRLILEAGQQTGIILSESTTVRSGPGPNNPQLAEIHEGLKVSILVERDQWYQVSLPNGLSGWIRKADMETI